MTTITMEFQWEGTHVKLAGNTKLNARQVTFTQFSALILEGEISGVYRLSPAEDTQGEGGDKGATKIEQMEETLPSAGKGILKRFQKVFEDPKQLPPIHNIDHRIFLQPGSVPVNVRPYCYPYFQKDVMEKLVKEMLEYGFIRPSTSPYSSPVLLVKKKRQFMEVLRRLSGLEWYHNSRPFPDPNY